MAGLLGIVGGMGPLASAEFLRTLYRLNTGEREQEAPACLLHSDPSFPDRTEVLLAGGSEALAQRLEAILEGLLAQGAGRIVITCVTLHAVLDRLPERQRRRLVSLVDVVVDEASAAPCRRLLLATTGTRVARIFEKHSLWPEVAGLVSAPDDTDQRELHAFLYELKKNRPIESPVPWLGFLAAKYDVEGFIFGCTELHLLPLSAVPEPYRRCTIDPLWVVARDVKSVLENLGEI